MNDQIRGVRQAALLAAALAGGLLQAVSAAETVDNFTDASNWGAPIPMEGAGGLAFANGRLNFTSPSMGNAGAAIARKEPSLPFDQSWSLQVDVHLDPVALTTDGQFSDVFLAVGRTGDEVNTLVMYEFGHGLWGAPGGYYLGDTVNVNGKKVEDKRFGGGLLNITATESALRLDYDGATHTLTYSFDADGPTAGYQWTPQGTANLASGTCNLGMSAGDTFTIILAGSSAYQTVDVGQAYWSNLVITTGTVAPTAPTITGQPAGVTTTMGQTATLTVTATGAEPLSYQWYQGASGDTNMPMANATNLVFSTPELSATTSYWVRVSNAGGGVDSATATITVLFPPQITVQPASQTISSDTNATLSVTATGAEPLSYQWYRGASGDTNTPMANATNSILTTPALSTTTSYWVRVSNADGVADSVAAIVYLRLDVGLLGSYDTPGDAQAVQVVGTTAYVVDGTEGLQILDVSHPANVVRLGGYNPGNAVGVQVVGTTAYLADWDAGLQILDVSNPAHVVRLGGYGASGWARAVQVVGTTAYVVGDTFDGKGFLQILDVNNPTNLVRLGGYNYPGGSVLRVQVVGTTAYLKSGLELVILDVSDPASVVRSGGGFMGFPGGGPGLQIVGTTAYVANGAGGLQILDVSNPGNVVYSGAYRTPGSASGVQVVGTTAYVVDGTGGLQILDVSNPANVVCLGGYDTPVWASGVQVVGTIAYVTDGFAGLQILEVRASRPPAAPPSILTGDGSLGVTDGRFGFRFAVPAGQTFVLEASTNLAEWMPLRTNISDGLPVAYSDPQWTNYVGRFYRVRVP